MGGVCEVRVLWLFLYYEALLLFFLFLLFIQRERKILLFLPLVFKGEYSVSLNRPNTIYDRLSVCGL